VCGARICKRLKSQGIDSKEFFLCSPCHPFLFLLFPSLSNVLCPLSHVSVPCLPSRTSQFFVFRPLSRLCSLPPVRCPVLRLCSLSPLRSLTSLFRVSRPLSPVLRVCSMSLVRCPQSYVSVPCLPSAVPSLTSLFLVSRPLSPVLRLCSLSLVLCTLSHVICPLSFILLSPSPKPYQLSQSPISLDLQYPLFYY
jgi:hypothetical protein